MEKEKKYREEKITSILSEMYSIFSELSFLWEYSHEKESEEYLEKESKLKDDFKGLANSLYNLICCYFESIELKDYLSEFKKYFQPILSDRGNLFKSIYIEEIAEQISWYTSEVWRFIQPFEFSQGEYLDRLLQNTGIFYIEKILKNTQVILNRLGVQPNTEPQIYNEVKFVVQCVYPSALEPSPGFFKCFKNYRPDILIPELHIAVEYKYADSEAKLKNQIDEISADTKAYTDDLTYNIFYAIFYVTEDFWGIEKFKEAWATMKYPKNWKAFYIVGR